MTKAIIPANLDLDALLEEHPPAFKYKKDKFLVLLGIMTWLKTKDKSKHDDKYVILHSPLLQKKVHDYADYMRYLVEHEVLISDGQYIVGEKSKGYWYHSQYAAAPYTVLPVEDYVLSKPSERERTQKKLIEGEYGYLSKWLNEGLQINQEAANMALLNLRNADYVNYQKDIYEYRKMGKNRSHPDERYRDRLLGLELFGMGEFNPSVDNTVKRFHSGLVRLKSELRNFITYEGKQLCSIDVKNSQPFISMVLFNPEFYRKKSQIINLKQLSTPIFNQLKPYLDKILDIVLRYDTNMLVKSDESQCGSAFELYCTLVDKGRIYPYIANEYQKQTGIVLDVNVPDEKKKIKEAIFVTLFSDNSFFKHKKAEMKKLFSELFPEVYEVFALIKEEDNAILPIVLQMVESEIVLRRACVDISQQYPDLPIFTIHDSIVTLEEAKDYVHQILKHAFLDGIGVMPNLAMESWKPENFRMK